MTNAKIVSAARYRLQGETISKYWSQVNKEKKLRDIVYSLHTPNLAQALNMNPATRSDKMAELTHNYHDKLQNLDNDQYTVAERSAAWDNTLDSVFTKLSNEANIKLNEIVMYNEVDAALRKSENGKAAGLDSIPYEAWKIIHATFKEKAKMDQRAFDIVGTLTQVMKDIQTHKVALSTNFTEGWMCPIFKLNKPDKTNVENYRPITLLNTDYKIFTKCLATKLAKHAPSIIHSDQAGFITGRSIADQVKLAKLMVDYTKATEENRVIIALDQEKAYNKISHLYLWQTLKRFNLPYTFINTVKMLYEHAEMTVLINGEQSTLFKVTRGVQQGDPLSCLLFDLAIEPLACMIRISDLNGYKIDGLMQKVIVSMFADDTTVFLHKSDNIDTLYAILRKWCTASSAKFNIDKTCAIPLGTPEFWMHLVETRKMNASLSPLGPDINIRLDGTPTRILGAWIGNNTDVSEP